VSAARLPIPSHTAEQARRAAREVLSRPEFQEPARPLLQRLRDDLFDFLGRLLARLLEGATGSPVGWLVVAIVVAVLVALTVRFARGVRRDPEVDADGFGVRGGRRRTGADWRAEADALEAAGEWRRALRSRYRALVADLAARGLLDEVPGRTAGEYRSEVATNAPTAAGDFASATTLFEAAWYGGSPTDADDAATFRSLESRVLAEVR
jgi:hypothetical protein